MTVSRHVKVTCAVAASLAVFSCGTDRGASELQPSPVQEPVYSTVWSTGHDLDLFGRGAEVTRAAVEAALYATVVGAAQSFPGYENALPAYISPTNPAVEDFFVSNRPDGSLQKPMTSFKHLADLDDSSRSVKATVCDYWVDVEGEPNAGPEQLHGAWQVELANPEGDPGRPGIADGDGLSHDLRGGKVPTWDVFGSWKINVLRYIPLEKIPPVCADWWQERFPTFVHRNEYNALYAPPGYVPDTMPVAPQYPEWIGPSTP